MSLRKVLLCGSIFCAFTVSAFAQEYTPTKSRLSLNTGEDKRQLGIGAKAEVVEPTILDQAGMQFDKVIDTVQGWFETTKETPLAAAQQEAISINVGKNEPKFNPQSAVNAPKELLTRNEKLKRQAEAEAELKKGIASQEQAKVKATNAVPLPQTEAKIDAVKSPTSPTQTPETKIKPTVYSVSQPEDVINAKQNAQIETKPEMAKEGMEGAKVEVTPADKVSIALLEALHSQNEHLTKLVRRSKEIERKNYLLAQYAALIKNSKDVCDSPVAPPDLCQEYNEREDAMKIEEERKKDDAEKKRQSRMASTKSSDEGNRSQNVFGTLFSSGGSSSSIQFVGVNGFRPDVKGLFIVDKQTVRKGVGEYLPNDLLVEEISEDTAILTTPDGKEISVRLGS